MPSEKTGGPQLWAKGLPLDEAIHRFTVGDDPATDLVLAPFDAIGSAAHARMLASAGLLAVEDAKALVAELKVVLDLARAGAFTISTEQEDCHTAIEAHLTETLGEAGRRIHLGRSRNDQVILALRLFYRQALLDIGEGVAELAQAFLDFSATHQQVPMPGYTHLRRAMPSSFGLWGAAFAEGLLEELEALKALLVRLDKCPLGSAAGFGAPLPLDRPLVAELLGFSAVQRSVVDVQNSRGRHELAILHWLNSAAFVVEKALWDLTLYTTQEFGFMALPDAFTTGSSIMPQKRNPDVVELLRGRVAELRGLAHQVEQIAIGLPSNYHRELQLLKKPMFAALAGGAEAFNILAQVVSGLAVDADKAGAACSDDLFAAQQAFGLVAQGLTFRDAYQAVGKQIQEGAFSPDRGARTATHVGSSSDLGLGQTQAELDGQRAWIQQKRSFFAAKESALFASGDMNG
ncbi:MAG: argininosuccinate lyase [Holophagaceae bacterium]|nr:argininosuccinate lyase [Holophagaceae bacterium]